MADREIRDAGARPQGLLAAVGAALIVVGAVLAWSIQGAGGVSVKDVRFPGAGGVTMSGLLYTPAGATAQSPAPGVLAVHGYINTRETQDAFAIELARRGFVVLAMDQRGHGYSGGAAMTEGFGGPDGLAYLRSLPQVDKDRIGLEGHSMGGWTVLAAAKAMPDGYRAMVLEGSSTGAPYAADGSTTWPRNLAVVFSKLDEFGPLMWSVPRSADVGASAKLKALFGVSEDVEPGRVYGDLNAGSARILHTPNTTHPGDHFSNVAVGHALDWFSRTLTAPTPRPVSDQIWIWKEIGTLIAFIGVFVLLLGLFDLLLRLKPFAALRAAPTIARERAGGGRWWALLLLGAFIPAVSFMVLPLVGFNFVAPSAVFPQAITNQLMVWALANAAVALLLGLALGGKVRPAAGKIGPAVGLALACVGATYLVCALVAEALLVDFRFWVVALKPLGPAQALAALAYLAPFTVFLIVSYRGLAGLMARGQSPAAQYATAIAALALGFLVLTGGAYAILFAAGALPALAPALNAIMAIQFVPLLAMLGVIFVFTWRRTGGYLPGALVSGLFVTWYIVAGTATHFGG